MTRPTKWLSIAVGVCVLLIVADPAGWLASPPTDEAGKPIPGGAPLWGAGWFTVLLLQAVPWVVGLLALGGLVRWQRRKEHPVFSEFSTALSPRAKSAAMVSRWGDKSRANQGQASRREVRRRGGRGAVRRKTASVRPSLATRPLRQRITSPTREVGVELARSGGRRVWASVEDVTLLCAGPRVGKTGWMACRVIDAPGSVVVTSIRDDLYKATVEHRQRRGSVTVFNAAGFPGIGCEIGFNPLTGCEQPAIASARAADMVPLGEGDRADWAMKARGALGSLMHAAALGGHTMDAVHSWAADPDKHKDDVIRLLRDRSPMPATVTALELFMNTNDKTRSSITSCMDPALKWLENPAARRAAGLDGVELPGLDAYALVRSGRDALYILGLSDENTHVTPLMAALAGHIASVARDVARQVGGRLDPPLELCLDEAAKIAPPLPEWTTDMGGSGVTIVAAVQSRADLVRVWGKEGAARIMNNCGAKLLGGGTADPDDLHTWVELAGNRDETVHTYDEHHKRKSSTVRSVPVLTASQLAHLPEKTVVVFRRGMRPTLGTLRMVWERWDVRFPAYRETAGRWWQIAITPFRSTSPTPQPAPVEATPSPLAPVPDFPPASLPVEEVAADAR